MSRSQGSFIGLGLMLLGVAGCSTASAALEKNLAEVTGVVYIDDKPAEGVFVSLMPSGTNTTAHQGFAVTDADGEFEVRNFQHKLGMPPGQYVALLTLWLTPEGELPPTDVPPATSRAMQVIPPMWHDMSKAGRHNSIVVDEEGTTKVKFKVKKK